MGNYILALGRDLDPTVPVLKAAHISDLDNAELMTYKKVLQINDNLPESSLMAVAEAMHNYPHLKLTFYSHADISRIDWRIFSHVRYLSIGGIGNWKDIDFLEQMPLLESLDLVAPLKCTASLLPIANLSCLKRLSLNGIQKDVNKIVWSNGLDSLGVCVGKLKDAAFLTNIPYIKNLNMGATQLPDYKVISDIAELSVLNLNAMNGFGEEAAVSLQQLRALKLLNISMCAKLKSIDFVAGLQQLKKLRLSSMRIATFHPLGQHETLQVVSTDAEAPTDKSLKGLYHIPSLYIGGRFPKEEIATFRAGFTGKDAFIGGVRLKGGLEANSFIYNSSDVIDV
ncbi:hypothetical protein [Chitinophaga sp. Cy-1792]|uniref:hypothetical protein n=1 Tax=Chitinophaga sp. Cy-1792 TaxID=2608339 RepID=UPI00141DDE35|nr:hypothetical protein [Chitinophaga sp. Cy-1792]NIG55808.1 hypothetical protein [Chitinophaga sp. Cy-1792]